MPLEIVTVPCLRDNYAYLLRDEATGRVGLVDAPEPGPIEAELQRARLGSRPDPDHPPPRRPHRRGGAAASRVRGAGRRSGGGCAPAAGARHRPRARATGSTLGESAADVIDVPGHTVGHVAYHFAEAGALFSADSLMVMGCGRLFEGTPEQMWDSLSRLAALPDATLVYSGHEYAESNARFALSVDGGNEALRAPRRRRSAPCGRWARPTVPARLDLERATNPFLRVSAADFKARNGLEKLPDAQVFAEIRRRKDAF